MQIKNITKAYADTAVLTDLSLDIKNGCVTAVNGASGRGKTTLINIITGLTQPDSGSLEDIPKPISMVFQEDRLLPWLNTLKNVELVCSTAKAEEYIKKVGLYEFRNYPIEKLSGGMKRRVALARALAADYNLLVLDEPFNGLDAQTREQMKSLILSELEGRTCIIISHSEYEISGFAEAIISI